MAILYKPFKPFRTVFYVLLAAFFCWSFPALAQLDPYVVEGVKVDVTADNAINARNQAFEKAQQEALKALAGQIYSQSQMASFTPPAATAISPMVQDFEVTQEKLSSKRYIATYTFRFKRSAVNQYFGQTYSQLPPDSSPVQAEDTSSYGPATQSAGANILILPFYKVGQQTLLWSAYNGWMESWRRTGSGAQIVPLGDLSDVADIGDDDALRYDETGLRRILARYSAREAAILIASPDSEFAQIKSDESPAAGMLKVDIYRTDRRDGPEQAGQVIVTATPRETRGAMFDRAALQVQRTLQSDWKNTSYVPQRAARSTIEMRVPFANLQEWASAQRALSRIHGVNDVVLKSLTPREARIGVVYEGNADSLRVALQQAGMDMSGFDVRADIYETPVYDLYLNKSPVAPQTQQQPVYQQRSSVLQMAPEQAPVLDRMLTQEGVPDYEPLYVPPTSPPPPSDSYIRQF
jgi:hypothetical protein